MPTIQRISPCLWFAEEAEEAARFYVGIFDNSKITAITRYGAAGFETHRRPAGSVMTVDFELDGQPFTALNGGPRFEFNPAISFQVRCATQDEIDRYWESLGSGGDPEARRCGWLVDRYGVSWQVVPDVMSELFADGGSPEAERTMRAMLEMTKLDIDRLQRARAGEA